MHALVFIIRRSRAMTPLPTFARLGVVTAQVAAPPPTAGNRKTRQRERGVALLRQWPRTSAALSFGAAGTALSLLWWSPVIFQSRTALPFVLFIGVSGFSATIVGWVSVSRWLIGHIVMER
jgi:hypothetical protein